MHARDAFVHLDEFRHIREIELWVYAKGEHVHSHRNDIDVARAFAVAEQRAFNTVRTSEDAHLRIGYAAAAVIVRMKRKNNVIAVFEVFVHVGNLHGKDMRHTHLNRSRQIDDGFAVGRRLPDIEDGIADFQCVLWLRAREGFRRILEAVVGTGFFRELLQKFCSIDGHLLDLFLILTEHLLTLSNRRRIVNVNNGVLDTFQSIKGLADDMLAGLREYLNRHIIWNQIIFYEAAQEFIFRLRSCRKTDFDFLEADFEEHLVEFQLLIETHRNDQRLVAVTQVDAAPDWCVIRGIFLRPLKIDLRRHKITFAVLLIIHHLKKPPQIEKPLV